MLLASGGRQLVLGTKLGAGGEGAVYEIAQSADAAKVYAAAPTADRVAKLAALVRMQTPELRAIAAWPLDTIASQGRVAGFVMPRIAGAVPLSRVLIPQSRKADFPRASWAWLAHVARNLALAVDAVHRTGVVIGDINESNFLVAADASVRLIDVDSYQVPIGSRVLPCDVGVPMFTPPELQRRTFVGLQRTANHDRFGLAVLIFMLLFMGRHPWAGTHAGPELAFDEGEPIRRLPFAWGRDALSAGFFPPHGSVRMEWLAPQLAALFERAFAPSEARLERPTGFEWTAALDAFERELEPCEFAAVHRYLPERGECPWCYLEQGEPPLVFFVTTPDPNRRAPALDVDAIERDVLALATPEPQSQPFDVRLLPRVRGYELPAALRIRRSWWWASCVVAALVVALCYVVYGVAGAEFAVPLAGVFPVAIRPRLHALRTFRAVARASAATRYASLASEWRHANDGQEVAARKRALLAAAAEYRSLPRRYASELKALERRKRDLQLHAHLERYSLEDAKIPGLGRKRKSALYASGRRSAADFANVAATPLPGFGATRRYALQAWHEHVKSRFRYDPALPLDERILGELRARELADRARLEATLRGGPRHLAAALERRRQRCDDLRLPLEAAALALVKANADVRRVSLLPFS